ncbi:hypothetical protein [Poriferisphaera corsica]|nr:hypothetical protein [Poriferisphaera corsica]
MRLPHVASSIDALLCLRFIALGRHHQHGLGWTFCVAMLLAVMLPIGCTSVNSVSSTEFPNHQLDNQPFDIDTRSMPNSFKTETDSEVIASQTDRGKRSKFTLESNYKEIAARMGRGEILYKDKIALVNRLLDFGEDKDTAWRNVWYDILCQANQDGLLNEAQKQRWGKILIGECRLQLTQKADHGKRTSVVGFDELLEIQFGDPKLFRGWVDFRYHVNNMRKNFAWRLTLKQVRFGDIIKDFPQKKIWWTCSLKPGWVQDLLEYTFYRDSYFLESLRQQFKAQDVKMIDMSLIYEVVFFEDQEELGFTCTGETQSISIKRENVRK